MMQYLGIDLLDRFSLQETLSLVLIHNRVMRSPDEQHSGRARFNSL